MHGEEVAEEVWTEFKQTTYETSVPGINPQDQDKTNYDDWRNWSNTVEENNRAVEGFHGLMD